MLRWWYIPFSTLFGAIALWGILRGTETSAPDQVLGVIVGAALGLATGVTLAIVAGRHDRRLSLLKRQFPEAVCAQCINDAEVTAALSVLGLGTIDKLPSSTYLTAVFSSDGWSLWSGSRTPWKVAGFAWAQTTVTRGAPQVTTSRTTGGYPCLRFTVESGDRSIPIQLAFERSLGRPAFRATMDQGEVDDLAERIIAVGGLPSLVPPRLLPGGNASS